MKDSGRCGCSGLGSPTAPATQDLNEMQILGLPWAPQSRNSGGWADHQGYNTLWVSQNLRSRTQVVLLEPLQDLKLMTEAPFTQRV